MSKILITGGTGTIGSQVVHLLRSQGVSVRAMVRDPARARQILGEGVEIVPGDFADPPSLTAALEGADAAFLACGNAPQQVDYECALIDAAAASGLPRIVKLSARGAEVGASVAFWHWHGQIEQHLARSSVRAVVLQPGFVMTNLLAAAESVRRQGALFAPASDARIAMIDPADVAAAAVVALSSETHDGHSYVLTGPQAITYEQVAADLSEATGRHVAFVDLPDEAAGPALLAAGLPPFAVEQVLAVFATLRGGGQSRTTDTVRELVGRQPGSFAAFARDHAAVFRDEVSASVGV